MIDKKQLELDLKKALSLDEAFVISDDQTHFQIIAVSDIFKELTRLKQHKMINNLLKEYIVNNQIHAISIKTYTNTEWQNERFFLGL